MNPYERIGIDQFEAAGFDEIIDVRSPSEFAEDHLPGAVNYPVLDDNERAWVGTTYKQVSPFAARRQGSALVAANIARYISTHFNNRPVTWKPLIYCWRGGQRSAAMTLIFRQIGWRARQLDGGYKAWRRHVITCLAQIPEFHFRVLCGATGTGKSRILHALKADGEQVLDLEALACHKGSVLGIHPDTPQPSQKMFESRLWSALSGLTHNRPVFVEAESRKIGRIRIPEPLLERMHVSPCLRIEAPLAARVAFLIRDYDYFLARRDRLAEHISALTELQGRQRVSHWQMLAQAADWQALVEELLEYHYDPLYQRSQNRNYPGFGQSQTFYVDHLDDAGIERAATMIHTASTGPDSEQQPGLI